MKRLLLLLKAVRWILIPFILLFALATFMGKNYGQTICLVLAVVGLTGWPKLQLKKQVWMPLLFRSAFVLTCLILCFTVFSSGAKHTIYTSPENEAKLLEIYDSKVKFWPTETKDLYVRTSFGFVHILTCGSEDHPPIVLLHAASLGAHSWAENLEPLVNRFQVFAIDNIGEGNKSQLTDAMVFPQNGKEIADLYASILDSLDITAAPVWGASNGGYIAQMLAYYHPEKVTSLTLFAPMGITPLSSNSVFMMSIGSLYPFPAIRQMVTHWAIGTDEYCNQKYGDWFDIIVKGTIPSIAMPQPLSTQQKAGIAVPILLFIGTEDPIVGNAETAKALALDYPNIQIEVLKSGHLIAVEQREYINQRVSQFQYNNR